MRAAKVAEGRKFLSIKSVIHYPGTLDRRTPPIVLLLQLRGLPISGSSFPSYFLKYVSASHPITRPPALCLCWSVLPYPVWLTAGYCVSRSCGGDAAASEAV